MRYDLQIFGALHHITDIWARLARGYRAENCKKRHLNQTCIRFQPVQHLQAVDLLEQQEAQSMSLLHTVFEQPTHVLWYQLICQALILHNLGCS